jgi:SET domain
MKEIVSSVKAAKKLIGYKRRLNRNEIRRQRIRSLAEFATAVIRANAHKAVLKKCDNPEIVEAVKSVEDELIKVRTCPMRMCNVHSCSTKKDFSATFQNASQCEFCAETCGTDGCSERCLCYAVHRICNHSNTCYVCAAMPHRQPFPAVKATTEKFLKSKNKVTFKGLQACEFISKGRIIAEYTGEKLSGRNKKQILKRLKGAEKYIMRAGDGYIDGSSGNEMRYINSSCKPNVIYEPWLTAKGETKIFVVALHDIKRGEMIYGKYGWADNAEWHVKVKCLCGLTAECRKGNVCL